MFLCHHAFPRQMLLEGQTDSEGAPLLSKRAPVRTYMICAAVFAITTVSLAIALGVEVNKIVPVPDAPIVTPPVPPRDDSYDFPLREPTPWDILANHSRPLSFDVSEGTWMNVDVIPHSTTRRRTHPLRNTPRLASNATHNRSPPMSPFLRSIFSAISIS